MTERRSPEEWLRLAEAQAERVEDPPAWPDDATQAGSASTDRTVPPPSPPEAPSSRPHLPSADAPGDGVAPRRQDRVAPPPDRPWTQPTAGRSPARRPPAGRRRPAAADRGAWSRPRRVVEASEPTVTKVLVGAMVLVFLYQQTLDGRALNAFQADWALFGPAVESGRWWQLLTPALLHASLLHIGFNGYLLWVLGGQVELAKGHLRYGLVFVGSVLGGSVGHLLLQPDSAAVGASGGVFGLFGFFAVMMLVRGLNPMQSQIGPLILLNLAFTFLVPGIAIGGHLGGLLAGGALGGILTSADDRDQRTLGVMLAAIVTAALFAAGVAVA